MPGTSYHPGIFSDASVNPSTTGAAIRTAIGAGTSSFDGDYFSLTNLPSLFDGAFGSLSDTPTTVAGYGITNAYTKTEVDNLVTGLLDFKGNQDCSTNPDYPAGMKGDTYYVSVAGKIGGASGKNVEVGDVVVASADNAGGDEATVGTSWFILEHNLTGALVASNNLSDLIDATEARENLGLIIGSDVQAFNSNLTSISALTTTAFGRGVLEWADAAAGQTALSLGTAATLNVGTSANEIVQLDGTGKLPAVDGSNLLNLPGGNPFDQDLNTTDSPQFNGLTSNTGNIHIAGAGYFSKLAATSSTETYIDLQRNSGQNLLVISASGSTTTKIQGDDGINFENDTTTGGIYIGQQNARYTLASVNGLQGLGYKHSPTANTVEIKDNGKNNITTAEIIAGSSQSTNPLLLLTSNTRIPQFRAADKKWESFNSYTDASNNEGFCIDWLAVSNKCTIGTFKNGTGAARDLRIISADRIGFHRTPTTGDTEFDGTGSRDLIKVFSNNTEVFKIDRFGSLYGGTTTANGGMHFNSNGSPGAITSTFSASWAFAVKSHSTSTYSTAFLKCQNTSSSAAALHIEDGSGNQRFSFRGDGAAIFGTGNPDASALVDISSTSKGFLPPRMTGAQVEAIASPATSLIAYATSAGSGDVTSAGLWLYNGTNWVKII